MTLWLFGFPQPVVELTALFWLAAIALGLYMGLNFEAPASETGGPSSSADSPSTEVDEA